jgi:putative DNA primase/helicase
LKQTNNLSGIFNWMLEGLKMFREEGALPPKIVMDATSEYRGNSDKIGNFIAECLELTGKNSKCSDIYNRFQLWCNSNGFGCENKSNFLDELRGKNLLQKSGTVNNVTFQNVVKGYEIIKNVETDDNPFLKKAY